MKQTLQKISKNLTKHKSNRTNYFSNLDSRITNLLQAKMSKDWGDTEVLSEHVQLRVKQYMDITKKIENNGYTISHVSIYEPISATINGLYYAGLLGEIVIEEKINSTDELSSLLDTNINQYNFRDDMYEVGTPNVNSQHIQNQYRDTLLIVDENNYQVPNNFTRKHIDLTDLI